MRRLAVVVLVALWASAASAELTELPGCGTSSARDRIEIARHDFFAARAASGRGRALRAGPTFDLVGDLVVATDDGSLVSEANPFDLHGSSLAFEPTGAGYRSLPGAESIDASIGERFDIGDDATRVYDLDFPFPFFGREYRRVFVNSDGNLSFEEGDHASTARSLARFASGPPRVALFFADLDPSAGGELVVANLPERFVVTWSAVPEWGEERPNTFQVELGPAGTIRMRYGSAISATSAVVGLSPGARGADLDLSDLSEGSHEASGALAERFQRGREVDTLGLARAFYETFPDRFDALVVWTNFDSDTDDAFAYANLLKNDVEGIGEEVYDDGAFYGSGGELESFVFMGELARYPRDPRVVVRGAASRPTTLALLAHEVGHRWLAHARVRLEGRPANVLLGRQQSHWSFFFDTDASFLEGNDIEPRGERSFSTVATVARYSRLDLYLMGLAPAAEVAPMFFVAEASASGVSGTIDAESSPRVGVSLTGERQDVLFDDVELALGARRPDFDAAPKSFRHAWILLTRGASSPTAAEVAQLEEARNAFAAFFNEMTLGRGSIDNGVSRR